MNKSQTLDNNYEPWPALPYEDFKSTAHLLHMCAQAIGKLKLLTPFEPHWANVPLWFTSRGFTTGLIPYETGAFAVDMDMITHEIICSTIWGQLESFEITSTSVAELTRQLFDTLHNMGIKVTVNPKPQEIPNPVPFDQDTTPQAYDAALANAWWRIMVSSYLVMEKYHARFRGETPQIGLMWGTFDLRDARYNGIPVATADGPNAGYLRRNAMDVSQVEAGWWAGNDNYSRPAYFSFTYPQPKGIETAKILPTAARWDNTMGLFVLDYDEIRKSKNPESDLLAFFESTYQVGAQLAGWNSNLIGPGKPV